MIAHTLRAVGQQHPGDTKARYGAYRERSFARQERDFLVNSHFVDQLPGPGIMAKSAVERVAAASVAAHFLYKFMIIKLFHYKIYSMWADNYFEIARFKYNIAVGIRK